MPLKVLPPRPWEIDDLLDLGRREGEKAQYLKAIPVLILEMWVRGDRKSEEANYFRTKWAKNRIESSGLHEPFVSKGTSNIIAALSLLQKSRNLTPPLLEYQKSGVTWVNLPRYEPLLQDYRKKYRELYADDYKKLYPNPDEEPVWNVEEISVQEDIIEEDVSTVIAGIKQMTIFQVLEEYDKAWQEKLNQAEKRAITAEHEIKELREKLEQSQAELRDITEKVLDRSSSEKMQTYRQRIPEDVRIKVWRRDGGQCARCGSRENLEYDHIVPISRGGSNTVRNIELLCEKCNRSKGNKIE